MQPDHMYDWQKALKNRMLLVKWVIHKITREIHQNYSTTVW